MTADLASIQSKLAAVYLDAAIHVLGETGIPAVRAGELTHHMGPHRTADVTAVLALTGDIGGALYVSLEMASALGIVGVMMGEPVAEMDEIGESAIGELANMAAGNAGIRLQAETGVTTQLAPPLIIIGADARLAGPESRWVGRISTEHGEIAIHVALRAPR